MKYRKGYKYQLAEDEVFITGIHPHATIVTKFIELRANGRLLVKSGYAWDGPSGPTIDTANAMRGPLAHDALYQLMRYNFLDRGLRPAIDKFMYDCLREDGMSVFRAKLWYRSVRRFASWAAHPKNKKRVYEAPR